MTPQSPLFAEACVLCGSEVAPTKRELVEWREPVRNERGVLEVWSHVPRCVDRAACRGRVELELGEPWPLEDRTPAPPQAVTTGPLPAVVAPEPVENTPEPEVSPWLAARAER